MKKIIFLALLVFTTTSIAASTPMCPVMGNYNFSMSALPCYLPGVSASNRGYETLGYVILRIADESNHFTFTNNGKSSVTLEVIYDIGCGKDQNPLGVQKFVDVSPNASASLDFNTTCTYDNVAKLYNFRVPSYGTINIGLTDVFGTPDPDANVVISH